MGGAAVPTPRRERELSWMLAGVAAFSIGARPARALAGACVDPRVRLEGEIDSKWIEPIVRVCEDLAKMPGVDSAARLRIIASGDQIIVIVTLEDGRTAVRRLQAGADLRTTVEALMTVPPSPKPEVEAPPVAIPEPPRTTLPAQEPASAAAAPATTTMEIGVAVSGRLANRPTYLSLGSSAYAGLRVGRWLVGVSARWDAVQRPARRSTLEGLAMDSFGTGFLVAGRVAGSNAVALDVGATTLLLVESQSHVKDGDDRAGSATDVRLGVVGRVHLGPRALRFTVAVDAEISPSRTRRTIRIDEALPPLPAWSIGLGLGATWGGR